MTRQKPLQTERDNDHETGTEPAEAVEPLSGFAERGGTVKAGSRMAGCISPDDFAAASGGNHGREVQQEHGSSDEGAVFGMRVAFDHELFWVDYRAGAPELHGGFGGAICVEHRNGRCGVERTDIASLLGLVEEEGVHAGDDESGDGMSGEGNEVGHSGTARGFDACIQQHGGLVKTAAHVQHHRQVFGTGPSSSEGELQEHRSGAEEPLRTERRVDIRRDLADEASAAGKSVHDRGTARIRHGKAH